MTGNIAQIVALVSHGNKFLHTGEISSDFYPSNSVFQFCNRVDFRSMRNGRLFFKERTSVISEDPMKWLDYLKKDSCSRLRMSYRHSDRQAFAPDHMLAGLNRSGGHWSIQAIYGRESISWADYWDLTDKENNDQKIWSVAYFTVGDRHADARREIDFVKTTERLTTALEKIARLPDHRASIFGQIISRRRSIALTAHIQKKGFTRISWLMGFILYNPDN